MERPQDWAGEPGSPKAKLAPIIRIAAELIIEDQRIELLPGR